VAENADVAMALGESATTDPDRGRAALTIKIVSTVWRPVGPREPRVYWVRRAIVLAVLVLVVVVLVLALSGGSGNSPSAHGGSPPPTSPPATTTETTSACDPSLLTLVFSTDSDTYTSGETPKLVGVFSNPTTTACTLTSDPKTEIWTVKSGQDKIWTTKGCAKDTPVSQFTLKAGGTKTLSIFWNGHRLDPDCAVGDVALPGTYVLSGKLDGVKGQPAAFHITS
jgi:hypothetical protein